MAIFGKRIRGCVATGGWLLGPQVPVWAGDSAGTAGRAVGSEQGQASAGRDTQPLAQAADGPFGSHSWALACCLITSAGSSNTRVTWVR